MILCKVVSTGVSNPKNLTLEASGRSYLSYQALEKAINKQPENFEDVTQYVLITPSKMITTKAQTSIRFDTSAQIFPGIAPREKKTDKVKENA